MVIATSLLVQAKHRGEQINLLVVSYESEPLGDDFPWADWLSQWYQDVEVKKITPHTSTRELAEEIVLCRKRGLKIAEIM